MQKGKRGAIELSIGTIVVIVLAMSMLILGLVLVRQIFSGATSIADMTNEQVKNQVAAMFGSDKKLVVYPDSKRIEVSQGEINGFGIGLKNLVEGSSESIKFSYEVVVSDPDLRKKCDVSETEAEGWITTGRAEDNIPIAPGDFMSTKVLFNIPVGASLCTLRYRVNVYMGAGQQQPYATDIMDVTIKAG